MPRKPKHYLVPQTSRVCVTLGTDEIKEVRKIGIDLELPDEQVVSLAVKVLIERYRELSAKNVRVESASAFLLKKETEGEPEA